LSRLNHNLRSEIYFLKRLCYNRIGTLGGNLYMENKSNNKKPIKNRRGDIGWRIIKVFWIGAQAIVVLLIMGVLFAGGAAAGFFASYVKDEPIRKYEEIYNQIYSFNQTSEAYFKNNEFIGYLRTSEISQPVTIQEVSPYLIDAILATEDNSFYNHNGVNVRATARAVIEYITTGGQGTGGSTITQQLVKNQLLDPERELERKFKEMLLAIRIERMFDKDDIVEAYLNLVYLGFNANGTNIEGVKAGATGIFDVDVSQLNIAQSAYIAGMIQSPGRYTPFFRGRIVEENLRRGIERQRFVLRRMLDTGRITEAQHKEALDFNIRESLAKPKPSIVEKYPFLTFEIERRATEILINSLLESQGLTRENLNDGELTNYLDHARRLMSHGGVRIYTTIEKDIYDAFHEAVRDEALFGKRSVNNKLTVINPETNEEEEIGYLEQMAATLIDNETGAIIAMVEGRDFSELQYNLNVEPRQPGSAIKPLLVYAPALDLGLVQPASIIDDSPIFQWDFSQRDWWVPSNWNNEFQGLVTARRAMDQSYNLPAIKLFLRLKEEIDARIPFDYLEKMGITTLAPADFSATSVSIGGFTHGLTVEESTGAFATFANNGTYVRPYLIERIETLDGEIIYQHEYQPTYVFSEQTSFLMNDMLRTVVNQGTATFIRQSLGPDLDIAGKTGTTNIQTNYWFVGYTPQISMGVWSGYPLPERLNDGYGRRTQTIWVNLIKTLKEIRPEYVNEKQRFKMPENIVRQTVCSKSGLLPSKTCSDAQFLVTDYFNRRYIPSQTDDKVVEARTIVFDDKRYLAHDATPDDFVDVGIYVKTEPLVIPEELEEDTHRYVTRDANQRLPQELDPRLANPAPPAAPRGLQSVWDERGFKITWNKSEGQAIVGYRVYRAGRNGSYRHLTTIRLNAEPVFTDRYITPNDFYAYYITSVDNMGQESEPSHIQYSRQVDSGNFFVPNVPEPSAPTGLVQRRTLFGYVFSWQANDANEKIKHYNVYFSEDPASGFNKLGETSNTTYTHRQLNSSREIWYYVTAVNDRGESTESNLVRVNAGSNNPEESTPSEAEDPVSNGSSTEGSQTEQTQPEGSIESFNSPGPGAEHTNEDDGESESSDNNSGNSLLNQLLP